MPKIKPIALSKLPETVLTEAAIKHLGAVPTVTKNLNGLYEAQTEQGTIESNTSYGVLLAYCKHAGLKAAMVDDIQLSFAVVPPDPTAAPAGPSFTIPQEEA